MNAKYFANRNEGKNETKQKRETKTKLISKKKHKKIIRIKRDFLKDKTVKTNDKILGS